MTATLIFDIETAILYDSPGYTRLEDDAFDKHKSKNKDRIEKLEREVESLKTQSAIDKRLAEIYAIKSTLIPRSRVGTAAFDPTASMICALGYCDSDGDGEIVVLSAKDLEGEKQLLLKLVDRLEYFQELVGWNIRQFDLPFLRSRMMFHGLYLEMSNHIPRSKYDRKIIDLMDLIGGDKRLSQQNACIAWGVDTPPSDTFIDGSGVQASFVEDDMESICKHCEADVWQLTQLAENAGILEFSTDVVIKRPW